MSRATHRTFAACDLTDEARAALARAQAALRDKLEGVRWTAAENLHLTMRFLGDVSSEDIGEVLAALSAAVADVPPLTLRLGRADVFPNWRRPAVIVAHLDADETHMQRLQDLHQKFSARLKPLGFAPEKRAFRPHVTLGRVRGGRGHRPNMTNASGDLREILAACALPAVEARSHIPIPIPIDEVILYESILRPRGPEYVPLGRAALDRAGRTLKKVEAY